MFIRYGTAENNIDVTHICFSKLLNKNNVITIPFGDESRSNHFTDPAIGNLKSIYVILKNGNIYQYDSQYTIEIDLNKNAISSISEDLIEKKIGIIHSKININYGSMDEELPEQKMAFRNLKGNEKVLEIGGNIGRNSLLIASILNNSKNLVTLESNKEIFKQLVQNRDLNDLDFNIENAALSKRKLIQKGWDTMPSDILIEDYEWVNTITIDELKQKYNIDFDTLILDCEGAFYFILMDMPEILDNINLIIMENDYDELHKKYYIDEILKRRGFYRDFVQSGGYPDIHPCYENFFEVWKRQ